MRYLINLVVSLAVSLGIYYALSDWSHEHWRSFVSVVIGVTAGSQAGYWWEKRRRARPSGPACQHDWMERGGPDDAWQECFLCGQQRDQPAENGPEVTP